MVPPSTEGEIHYRSGQFPPKTKTLHSNRKTKLILALHEPTFICLRAAALSHSLHLFKERTEVVECRIKFVSHTHTSTYACTRTHKRHTHKKHPHNHARKHIHILYTCTEAYTPTHIATLSCLSKHFCFHAALHFILTSKHPSLSQLTLDVSSDVIALLCQVFTWIVFSSFDKLE